MELHGRCHCGNIRYVLAWPGEPASLPARACACSFCSRHGAAWTAHPEARLAIETSDDDAVSRYAFETKTAEFWICARCGVVPVCTSRIDGRDHAVVNVNTLDAANIALERAPVSFGDEDEATRLQRRKRRWIGSVRR